MPLVATHEDTAMPSRDDFRAFTSWHRARRTCYVCEKPVTDGQAYHGATGAHWDCHKAEEQKTEDAFAKVGGIEPKRKREGEGKTAKKAKLMAVDALAEAIGGEIFDVTIWNQQGVYRGPRWDLDSWGVIFTSRVNGLEFKGSASSLATMTQCVAHKSLKAIQCGHAYEFDLHIN